MSEEQAKPRRKRARASEAEVESPADAASEATEVTTAVASATPARPGLLHRIQLDPATGLAFFVPGLFVMAVGGAMTWHWIFNLGEGVMLLGMTYFVAAVTLTALQQRSQGKRPSGPPEPQAG